MFGLFRRPPQIVSASDLAAFVDQRAAFVVQKGIYEYSRARAGHYSKVLFAESGFREAVEQSRWKAFPLGLVMVTELAEGLLRPHVGDERRAALDALTAMTLAIFDRYATPAAIDPAAWEETRATLANRLDLIGVHGVKAAKDVPEPYAQAYFDLMPIHKKLRASEFPTIRNYLRITLCNVHEELEKRMDAAAVAREMFAGAVFRSADSAASVSER